MKCTWGAGGRIPWWGSEGKASWSWQCFRANIVIEALTEHVFPCCSKMTKKLIFITLLHKIPLCGMWSEPHSYPTLFTNTYNTIQYKKHLDAPFPKGSERLQRKTLILQDKNYNSDQVHILKVTKNETKLRKHETLEKTC